ncbi:50S ribosomal protein L29 [Desulfothermobacter acidiphilus]|uniref:50S ribosomal protein L29 n=1 Tax=Desulfothermobacter acidiphilus TaxID=1938353 RepID=UPI003F8A4A74
MKIREIRDLSNQEIEEKLRASKEELFRLRLQVATGQLENPMRIREVKRRIARLKTVLRERELKIDRAIG